MSFRSTAILLAILAVLGAGVYFFEVRANPDPSGLDPKLQIWKLDKDTVERVVARVGADEQVMQKRADGLWYLEPQDVKADYWRISGTLVRLSNMRATKRVTESPRSLADYGLDTPRAGLTLRAPDGVDHTLLIGEKSPTEAGYFAKQPESNLIWLVGTFNVEDVERFVKEPAYEPTPVPTREPSPAPASTPSPSAPAPAVPPTLVVPATPAP